MAFVLDEGERRVCCDGIAQFFELTVDGALAKRRGEGKRVEEDVNIFGEPGDQVPALGEAGASLEDDSVAWRDAVSRACGKCLCPVRLRDGAQCFRDVVVLFDDGGTQPLGTEVIRSLDDRLLEIGVLEESHADGLPLACHFIACLSSVNNPKSYFENGLSES